MAAAPSADLQEHLVTSHGFTAAQENNLAAADDHGTRVLVAGSNYRKHYFVLGSADSAQPVLPPSSLSDLDSDVWKRFCWAIQSEKKEASRSFQVFLFGFIFLLTLLKIVGNRTSGTSYDSVEKYYLWRSIFFGVGAAANILLWLMFINYRRKLHNKCRDVALSMTNELLEHGYRITYVPEKTCCIFKSSYINFVAINEEIQTIN